MKITAVVALLTIMTLLIAYGGGGHAAHAQGGLSAPANVVAQNTGSAGEVRISWDAVPDAVYYRIGWVAYTDVEPIIASGGDWLERFAFIDIQNRGQTEHTIARLTPGVQYAFIVASNDGRYGIPQWPPATGWRFLNLAQASASQAAIGTASVNVSWDAVPGAAYYRIGWVVYSDVEPIIASGGDWLEHFAFIDIANREQTEHTITRLTPGLQYAFIVAGNDGRYGTPQWPDASGWQFMTPPGWGSFTCPARAPNRTPRPVGTAGDYDADDDGLIEVSTVAQLAAIRYDPQGFGSPSNITRYHEAFPGATFGMGCPTTGCMGYELVADLNLGDSWSPIGTFSGFFDGGGYIISYAQPTLPPRSRRQLPNWLFNATSGTITNVGLVPSRGSVRGLGLSGNNSGTISYSYSTGNHSGYGGLVGENSGTISYSHFASTATRGGLAAENSGTITASCATGAVSSGGGLVGTNSGTISYSYAAGNVSSGGGLVRTNSGEIISSYATGNVSGGALDGGLVGSNQGTITSSFATGNVSDSSDGSGGGLVGRNDGTITSSYATGSVTGQYHAGGLAASNGGTIISSFATGNVFDILTVAGGLVGGNAGTIAASYATGDVYAPRAAGGLVAGNSGTISSSFATGDVFVPQTGAGLSATNTGAIVASYAVGNTWVSGSTRDDTAAGLVALNSGRIIATYSIGGVSIIAGGGDDVAAGLVGRNDVDGAITASYSIGRVSVQGRVFFAGGLVGTNSDGQIVDSYWDTLTSGLTHSAGGVGGKSTHELQSLGGYTGIYANWDVDVDNSDDDDDPLTGVDDPWDFGTSRQYPVLKYGNLDPAQQQR